MAASDTIGFGIIRTQHASLRGYGLVATAAALALVGDLYWHGKHAGPGDFQSRACLEPVYAGIFGTGPGALERCLKSRAKLFGARDSGWLRYVRHLEQSCPASIGMQGQAICEFQVKSSEDHLGIGWRSKRYQEGR